MGISWEGGASDLSSADKAQLDRVTRDVQIIKDQMAKVAVVLKHLSQAVANQHSKSTPQLSEIGLILQSMQVHVDSFPHALREARSSDLATQRAMEKLAHRLSEIEARVGTICASADLSEARS